MSVYTTSQGAISATTMLWATCVAMLTKVANAIQYHGVGEALKMKARIIKFAAGNNKQTQQAWNEIQNHADANAARCALMVACRADAGECQVRTAIVTFKRLEDLQAKRDDERARKNCKGLVTTSSKEGSGSAHR